MKRFYKEAAWQAEPDGACVILLDGRGVKTPARAALAVPSAALADAIIAEWNGQGEEINPASMPMTGFANATIDRVLPDVASFADGIAQYATTDLLCYRAEAPPGLVEQQAAAWDPLLDWARARYDIAPAVTTGIIPVTQPPAMLARLAAAVHALDPWLLSGFSVVVSLTGTLIGALALLDRAVDPDALWDAAHVDELWQARLWGEDADAKARLDQRHGDFAQAVDYCMLVVGDGTGPLPRPASHRNDTLLGGRAGERAGAGPSTKDTSC